MKLTLPRFGLEEVEIDPNTLIQFPNGLLGFEGCKHFKLFHSGDSPAIFWLQSIDDPLVVFSLTDPESLHIRYDMTLTDEELSALQVDVGDELQIAVILVQQEAENNTTVQSPILANYRSPVIVNVSKQVALQKSLHNSESWIRTCQPLHEAQQALDESIPCFHEASRMRSVASDSLCSFA